MDRIGKELRAWLTAFAAAIRARNYAAGRALFDPDVVAFGSACFRADGIDGLVDGQWAPVWSATTGFDFDYERAVGTSDGSHAVVAVTWRSTGFGAARAPFERRGRATFVLRKSERDWKATHSHLSLAPPGS
jgi:ketosteroid isomerase-like protein